MRDRIEAAIKDAYYSARDNGGTMHTAATDATDAVLAVLAAPDEATIERLAEVIHARMCGCPYGASTSAYRAARETLAALADSSAQARHTDGETGGGACTCVSYVVDHSHPEPRHPENVDTELTPGCPEHDPEGVAGE